MDNMRWRIGTILQAIHQPLPDTLALPSLTLISVLQATSMESHAHYLLMRYSQWEIRGMEDNNKKGGSELASWLLLAGFLPWPKVSATLTMIPRVRCQVVNRARMNGAAWGGGMF